MFKIIFKCFAPPTSLENENKIHHQKRTIIYFNTTVLLVVRTRAWFKINRAKSVEKCNTLQTEFTRINYNVAT